MAADSNVTFRLRGIPSQYSRRNAVHELVGRALSVHPETSFDVHSVAANPLEPTSRVATLSFQVIPPFLSNRSKKEWVLRPQSDWYSDGIDGWRKPLVFDTHFYGFTPLQNTKEEDCKVDLIALSGLGGHAFGSFKQKNGSFMWIRDALPDDIPIARILIYGYDTTTVQSSSFQNLADLGRALQTDIRELRISEPCRPIIFIGHSLGGLVIKQAITSMSEDRYEQDVWVLQSITAFLFFGVPHQGMATGSLVPLVGDQPNRALLESLGRNSDLLQRLQRDFDRAFGVEIPKVVSYFETVTSPTAVKNKGVWELSGPPDILVDRVSATFGSMEQHPFDRNHSELVKFTNPYDSLYLRVRAKTSQLVNIASNAISQPATETLADPLLIASGAVEFVSLGLTACKSIGSFYNTYKDRDVETKSLVRKSEELRVVFESIECHLPQLQHSHQKLAESVAASILELAKSLDSLDPATEKSRRAKDSKDFKEKLRTVFSRAAYPLRRETILGLDRRVNDCRENLSFALTAMKMVRSDSAFTELSTQLQDLQTSMAKLQGSVDLVTPSSSQPSHIVARSSLPIDQPPLEISYDSPVSSMAVSRQQNYTARLCLCRPQRSGQKAVWQIGPFALFSHATRSSKHFPDCPYHIQWENTQRYGVEFMLPTLGGKHFVQAFLNWRVAGGFLPLSPGLQVRQVVSDNNPAFKALKSICSSYPYFQVKYHEKIDTAVLLIRRSFQERQASPGVTNSIGRNLLMAAFVVLDIRWEKRLKSPVDIQSFIDSFRKLIFALKEYGVPFNEHADGETTPGSLLLSTIMDSAFASGDDPSNHLFWTEMIKLLREIIVSYDLKIDKSTLGLRDRLRDRNSAQENNVLLIGLLHVERPWLDDFGCSTIGEAILRRSTIEMEHLVRKDPESLYDKTAFGHTAIHLAVGWPEGLELVLDLGGKVLINDVDAKGGSPLAYACLQHHFDSAIILMSKDCRIDANLLFLAIERHHRSNSKILDFLLPELIRRRQQLIQFARYHLGECFVESLGIPPDAVPDQWAVFEIQEACHENKTPVPERMRHSFDGLPEGQLSAAKKSVFSFLMPYSPSTMDFLWLAGFRVRLDPLPWMLQSDPYLPGPEPMDILEKTGWLISRGFDVHSRLAHDTASFIAYHTLGHVDLPFGYDFPPFCYDVETSVKKGAEIFEEIYFSSFTIDHLCPCSLEGCTAATALLVREVPHCNNIVDGLLWAVFSMESTIQFSSEAAESGIIETIAASSRNQGPPSGFPTCPAWKRAGWVNYNRPCWLCRGRAQRTVWQKERWIKLASKLLRAYLFQFLRLTHSRSCCKAGLDEEGKAKSHRPFVCVHDEDTVRKRQEEERPRVVELESLVQKLVQEFKSESTRLTMSRFIEEVAKPRAEKLREGWEDKESKRKPQQSGVVYEIDSDDSVDDL